jgi:hypothetical protein
MTTKPTDSAAIPDASALQPATSDNQLALLTQLGELQPVAERPADLNPNDRTGTEGITADEIRLPRLAIAQGLSPQMIPTESSFIKGLSLGDLFNDVTNQIYQQPLIVVPIMRNVVRIEFDPNDKKVPLDMHVPVGDPRLDWTAKTPGGKKDTPPRATEFFEFVCLVLEKNKLPELVMLSIKATNKYQRKAATDWTTYIAMRNAPIFNGMYAVSTKFEKGKAKDGQDTNFGVYIIKNAGFVPTDKPAGQALLAFARKKHEELSNKVIDVNRSGDDDDITFDTKAIEAGTDPGM